MDKWKKRLRKAIKLKMRVTATKESHTTQFALSAKKKENFNKFFEKNLGQEVPLDT